MPVSVVYLTPIFVSDPLVSRDETIGLIWVTAQTDRQTLH
jgi:hypothetical protein